MKTILIAACFLASCSIGKWGKQEIEVRGVYVTVMDVTDVERYGIPDKVAFHLKSDNGVKYYLERPAKDTAIFLIGNIYPFLSPR